VNIGLRIATVIVNISVKIYDNNANDCSSLVFVCLPLMKFWTGQAVYFNRKRRGRRKNTGDFQWIKCQSNLVIFAHSL